jgi:DNA (cytosine-5)-methyltransferase 1
MKVLDLFAGIGGFTLALERAGFETVAFCEIEPYAKKVLAKNWPGVPIYDDVRTITADRLVSDGIRVDVITGGFPCQDISVAGNQAGIEGERSGLWTECARLIGELRPRYAIFENVTNLLNGERGAWFKRVLWDISSLGYDAEWHCIPACELGAHHRRDRVWIVAYTDGDSQSICSINAGKIYEAALLADSMRTRGPLGVSTQGHRQKRNSKITDYLGHRLRRWEGADCWATEPDVGRVAHGIPARSHRLKCLGNAVVPPIPELIGRAIMQDEGAK